MTLSDLFAHLNAIDGFSGKVAYYAFPESQAPQLPYICYLVTSTQNFAADNKVYSEIQNVDIELYTETKDEAAEKKIENALDSAEIVWERTEDYLESENCFMITFSIQI